MKAIHPPPPPRHKLHFEAQMRSAIALAVALVAFFGMHTRVTAATSVVLAWDAFAFTLLVLIWIAMLSSGIEHIRHRARTEDLSRLLIFAFTIAGACASIFAVVALMAAEKKATHVGAHAALSVVAVIESWVLLHTMFALRYAHFYYGEGDSPEEAVGGLQFPNDRQPVYLDFAYFSFVIGMTAQVSDVGICSKHLRVLALIHGVLSFCFNTIILALTINSLSGLL